MVAENLAVLLGSNAVSTRDDVVTNPDCRVRIDVLRFDAEPGRAASLDALWTVRCGLARRTGRSRARQPVGETSYEAVVAAHGRTVDAMSVDLADAIRDTSATGAEEAGDRVPGAAQPRTAGGQDAEALVGAAR